MAHESTDAALYPVLVSEDFRCMSIPTRVMVLGCVGDRDVKRVGFEVPRFCDELDLAGYDIQVHFTGAKGTGDWSPALDVDVGDDAIRFAWEPTRIAFEAEGLVRANVRMTDGTRTFNSGVGTFHVMGSMREEPQGSPLVDGEGDLIVITVAEEV